MPPEAGACEDWKNEGVGNFVRTATLNDVSSNVAVVASLLGTFSLQTAYASFTLVGTLEILSEASFTALTHPELPHYGVHIKKTSFCDSAYTRYIDIQARHLFFYFLESRSNPEKDDAIFWTNGAELMLWNRTKTLIWDEPRRVVNTANGTVFRPESWNSNIFLIDQPIGVGFSTTEDAAKDIITFVAIFFAHFANTGGKGWGT
ncbi:hypothetical protein B0H17DRAFT_1218244 [Mycena rosella]|uniref:Uncharacterized protein n=1 Tax=Mycena rosella TaxID=1033263 RepID=A0AAD7BSC4_MYCRO|nr:hypothetical protein B0H17DRAFT_1218244 [Mycena rosella]